MPVDVRPVVKSQAAYEFVRRYPRILFSIPITIRHLCRGGVRTTHGISLDLGEAGLGAIVQGDVQVGETVAIEFQLSEQLLKAVAIVRYSSSSVGSGFEFVGLTPEERLQITRIIGSA
ncbi:MAG TPA: PilZ domain-containing protein [Candidatus Sulfotelmatobacter sp.]|nr:PilZ domain-containing protein [Candidatus Sulfotelmatobacter sp.]HLM82264.1 PilZ domain-containing protein [Terriglobales bacterium]